MVGRRGQPHVFQGLRVADLEQVRMRHVRLTRRHVNPHLGQNIRTVQLQCEVLVRVRVLLLWDAAESWTGRPAEADLIPVIGHPGAERGSYFAPTADAVAAPVAPAKRAGVPE